MRFERDDALLFFKLLVAEDESEVGVVVTANMFTCVWSSTKTSDFVEKMYAKSNRFHVIFSQ